MDISDIRLPPSYQTTVERFVNACQSDERITAAYLSGSYARGEADEFSDLDLHVMISDDAFEDFNSKRYDFIDLLGEPLLAEDFDIPNMVFYIFANSVEGELHIERESKSAWIRRKPTIVLVDKRGHMAGDEFTHEESDRVVQIEKLRRLIYWFWHDLSHFVTAIGRDQLWWAHGQLEELRRYCVNLARIRNDLYDPEIGNEPYFKIDNQLKTEQLSPLIDTFCSLEKDGLIHACISIIRFYKELARSLAQTYELTYPAELERMMVRRLNDLSKDRP